MAINKFFQEKGLLYQLQDNGEKWLVRSSDSSKRAYLRFTNKTSRPVEVWWRDFRGVRHQYFSLDPGSHFDINSYVTHPWEFSDPETDENFVINNCIIFRAPPKLGGMSYRTNWNITVSVRSLRFAAMLVIAERIHAPCCIPALGLPKTLEKEMDKLVRRMRGLETEEEKKA
uniref:von Hippel-Lindau disease tumour suppressor beta domain-containing protein n=1 Tax=Pectinophora gossypiella TaxID=13191 RepID=A0A1E1VYX5_PECGO